MKIIITFFLYVLVYSSTAQMPNTLSNADKIYGLSQFWQEVNYNFVYLNKIDRDAWNKAYLVAIERVQNTQNDYEYYRELQKLCATLNDGHTNVYFPESIQKKVFTTYFGDYRIFLENIEGEAILTRINPSKKEDLPIGSKLIRINGQAAEKYIQDEVYPYISSSTEYIREDLSISNALQGPVGSTYYVEWLKPNGETVETQLIHAEPTEKEIYPEFPQRNLLDFEWKGSGIAYLALNSFSDAEILEEFENILPELYKAEKLILDLRFNGGGNNMTARSILQYLTADSLIYGARTSSRLHIPAFKAWGLWTEATDTVGSDWATQQYLSYRDNFFHNFDYHPYKITISAKRIVIPTAILTSHQTASAAEDMLVMADNQSHMTRIGEPTFGSTGQPYHFDLPGGGWARVCTKADKFPDGREFVGYGVQPDISVIKTLDDYMKNNDPVLEAALKFLNEQ